MTFKDIAKKISNAEGKKHQSTHGDVLEILKLVSIEIAGNPLALVVLLTNGLRHRSRA